MAKVHVGYQMALKHCRKIQPAEWGARTSQRDDRQNSERSRSLKLPVGESSYQNRKSCIDLSFVLAAVDRVINETTAYDKIHLITVWYCNIYLSLKILNKILFSYVKTSILRHGLF